MKEEGYEIVLVNSNPATIMTDPDIADVIYVEPLTVDFLKAIIKKEKPDALLPGMGGQTALNLALQLHKQGVLESFNVEVIGTSIKTIEEGEDRQKFKMLMNRINEPLPENKSVNSIEEAEKFAGKIGFPVVVRPAYTLGGTGGGVAFDNESLKKIAERGLKHSMIKQVLIEKALLGVDGWGEFEIEVMRDRNNNCIIICPMENLDPMGIHTGESIVVAPTQTLNDHDFQTLRHAAIRIIRALKVEGGCNIQFAFNYDTGEYRIVEVNPRVSRSSALASKATGYPIARIAAKIAIGMTLDEIPNDVTKETTACFEPTIDYVVVKIPRWPFDKFSKANTSIGTQMKSTGETMAIGRTFEEAFQKALRSLETGRKALSPGEGKIHDSMLEAPTHERIFYIDDALRQGYSVDRIHELTGINKWFITKIKNICDFSDNMEFSKKSILDAKRLGFSDSQIAGKLNRTEKEIRDFRIKNMIVPTYKMVDTCAAEFEAKTPYLYSTYETEDESNPSGRKKVIIIGGGPIRIGQGIEFDYCCVHSAFALRDSGVEAIIINNNPETVSTDFDTSDKLYFEPLTFEDVMNVVEREKPFGVILQFGGQTSVNLAMPLHRAGVNILGTSPKMMDIVEDREKFTEILDRLNIPQALYGTARSVEHALEIADKIGYPVLVRPSYVLGGRAMEIVRNEKELEKYMKEAISLNHKHPVLIDKFLDNSIELDVDAVSDGKDVFIAAIMEHIEQAGIHSGDSACVIPPQRISRETIETVIEYTKKLSKELNVIGLINIQYAVRDGKIYVIEANPRASRTVPYVSKTIGVPLAKTAAKVMLGKTLAEMGLTEYKEPGLVSVKEAVFPFLKLYGVDPALSPEMKSTGEVMSIDSTFGKAFYKAQKAAYMDLPAKGNILFSIGRKRNKELFVPLAKEFSAMGFNLFCTEGTHRQFTENNVKCTEVPKLRDDPKIIDMMQKKELDLVIIVPSGPKIGSDGYKIRRSAVELNLPYITTFFGTKSSLEAIKSMAEGKLLLRPLGKY